MALGPAAWHIQAMHADDAYLFRHAVVRDAAYQLQPPESRAALHAAAVAALEVMTPVAQIPSIAASIAEHARYAREGEFDAAEMLQTEARYLTLAVRFAADRDDLAELLRLAALLADLPGLDPREQIEALVRLGQAALGAGKTSLAVETANRMLRAAEQLADPVQIGRAHRARATVNRTQGLAAAANAEIQTSIRILEGAGDGRELANSLIGAALFCLSDGRSAAAKEVLARALRLSADHPLEKSKTLRVIGDALVRTADPQGALEHYQAAIAALPPGVPKVMSINAREGIAHALMALGRLEEAKADTVELLQTALDTGRWSDAPRHHAVLGEIATSQGQLDVAESHFREELRLAREIGRADMKAMALGNLGTVLLQRGKLAEADANLSEALRMRGADSEGYGMVSTLRYLGDLRQLQQRDVEAVSLFRRSLELAEKSGDSRYIQHLRAQLARFQASKGP